MKLSSNALRASIALGLVGGLAGCFGPYLRWKSRPAAASVAGKLDIVVTDRREEKKGGTDPRHIGNERNGWGIPFAVKLKTPTEAAASVRDLLGQAALTAGVGVVAAGDPTATSRLQVEIQNMWCDGYPPVYKASFTAAVTLTGPDNAVRIPAFPILVDGGHMGCQGAYQNVLSKAYEAAVTAMSQPNFVAAAQ